MSKNSEVKAIRTGSHIAEVYNDGMVVYLYDEAVREELRREEVLDIMQRALDEKTPANDKAVKAFGKNSRLVVYELLQDDSLRVEVAVGAPPERTELAALKGLKWLKAQTSRLNLPSGKLCVESANSCRIDKNQDAQEPGATLAVPPGDYVLTLCRLDVLGTSDDMLNVYRGPQEFITLTPVDSTHPPKPQPWGLCFPSPKKPGKKWIGNYAIDGRAFTCMMNFGDYWEFFQINLDRAAAAQLGLEFGSVLKLKIDAREFAIVLLGDGTQFGIGALHGYKILAAHDPMTAELLRQNPEVAFGHFRRNEDAGTELLVCQRVKAGAAIDDKFHQKWCKANGELQVEKLQPAPVEQFTAWSFVDGALHGQAMFRGDRYLTLNFSKTALAKLNAKPGDRLLLGVNGKEHALTFFADAASMNAAAEKASKPSTDREEDWDALWTKQCRAPDSEKPEWAAKLRCLLNLDPYLAACPDKHWYRAEQEILLVHPRLRDRQVLGLFFPLNLDAEAGNPVTLRKST